MRSAADFRKLTPRRIKAADIVVVSQSLVETNNYTESLSLFASGFLPKFVGGGRSYLHGYKKIVTPGKPSPDSNVERAGKLETRLRMLMRPAAFGGGPINVYADMMRNVPATLKAQVPDKVRGRLHGEKYIANAAANKAKYEERLAVKMGAKEEGKFMSSADAADVEKEKLLCTKLWGGLARGKLKWQDVAGLPLECFRFHRIVVDEYTYLTGKRSTLMFSLQFGLRSRFRWVLSGTPAVFDYDSVNATAKFVGVGIGSEAINDMTAKQAANAGMSQTEIFLHKRERHSFEWLERQHMHAQSFNDLAVRKTDPDYRKWRVHEHRVGVTLPPHEVALHLELKVYLATFEDGSEWRHVLSHKRAIEANEDGHRVRRLRNIITSAESKEEALLKSLCGLHSNAARGQQASVSALASIKTVVDQRYRELCEAKNEFAIGFADAVALHKSIVKGTACNRLAATADEKKLMACRCPKTKYFGNKTERLREYAKEKHFSEALQGIESLSGFDSMTGQDPQWAYDLREMVRACQAGTLKEGTDQFREQFLSGLDHSLDQGAESVAVKVTKLAKVAGKTLKVPKAKGEDIFAERYKMLRSLVDVKLRTLNTEVINRYRSHRFIHAIYKLVKEGLDEGADVEEDEDGDVVMAVPAASACCVCGKPMKRKDIAVLSCCGHVGHRACVDEAVLANQTCGYTVKAKAGKANNGEKEVGDVTLKCSVNASVADIIPVSKLGCRCDLPKGHAGASPSGKHGAKLTALVNLLKDILDPEKEEAEEDAEAGDVRVVLFVQYSDLMHAVRDMLIQEGIPAIAIEGSTPAEIIRADKAISGFKDRQLSGFSERVLLLNSSDVSASGVTLVRANHVIFLHPLFASSQHEFDSKERQAIGRVR